jgi:hypothetical protein
MTATTKTGQLQLASQTGHDHLVGGLDLVRFNHHSIEAHLRTGAQTLRNAGHPRSADACSQQQVAQRSVGLHGASDKQHQGRRRGATHVGMPATIHGLSQFFR